MPSTSLSVPSNWLPTSTADGLMAICKENFWDTFVVPRLNCFSRLMLNEMNIAIAYLNNSGTLPNPVPWSMTEENPMANPTASTEYDQIHAWRPVETSPFYTSQTLRSQSSGDSDGLNVFSSMLYEAGPPQNNVIRIKTEAKYSIGDSNIQLAPQCEFLLLL